MHHACADPVPAAVLLQEVLLAIAEKHRKQAKRPQLVGLHGRVPNPQLVALMKDCWHPVRSCCLWQLSMFCQSHHTFAFHIQTLCKTAYVLVAHKNLHMPSFVATFLSWKAYLSLLLLSSWSLCCFLACNVHHWLVCKLAGCCRMLHRGPTSPPSSKDWRSLLQRPSSALQMMHCGPSI